ATSQGSRHSQSFSRPRLLPPANSDVAAAHADGSRLEDEGNPTTLFDRERSDAVARWIDASGGDDEIGAEAGGDIAVADQRVVAPISWKAAYGEGNAHLAMGDDRVGFRFRGHEG